MPGFEAQYYEVEQWWTPGSAEDPANTARFQRTLDLIPDDASCVLDVGCGSGVFAKIVKSSRPSLHVACTDRSATALKYVRADEVVQSEITRLPFADKSFDCVCCLEVIEHLTQPDFPQAIGELARVANKYVIISVPFDEPTEKNMTTCPACFTKFNSDLHLRRFTLPYFTSLFEPHGLSLREYHFPAPQSHFVGFRSYYAFKRWILGDSHEPKFACICPVCGMQPAPSVPAASERSVLAEVMQSPEARWPSSPRSRSGLKKLVKSLWPRQVTPGYWIVGIFSRDK